MTLPVLNRRAEAILKARPAYREMVDFYLTVFRCQIEWRAKLAVHPEEVETTQARECWRRGTPLVERYDPGLDAESLLHLWLEMKGVFGRGNEVLQQAVEKIEGAEAAGTFTPAAWLLEQRPGRSELITGAAGEIEVDETILATLARAVTFPHWEAVADYWLALTDLADWKGSHCPVCGSPPGLSETRGERATSAEIKPATKRFLHCPFCGTQWPFPPLECPACGSTKPGDAKYLFTREEPELRVDFCRHCCRYLKAVDGDKIPGTIHVGLELLTTAHLDALAQDKQLSPLEF
ncbi:MAG: formate dehydrogenase accessory protein FdhE [Phycisphaerales bacterium]|nr:MAG: formate dehydrogenase accessory protein FdhE [Phycisphaerales bacterium]